MAIALDSLGKTILVSDGAMGTLLAPLLHRGEPPESLLLRDFDAVRRAHAEYAAAGADILTTNTFGAGGLKLRQHGLEARMEDIAARAVGAAREAGRGYSCIVAGSMGPLGDFLLPFGPISAVEALDSFRALARILIVSGVDAISIETMTDIRELRLAATAVREIDSSIPLFMQMSFAAGSRTITGTPASVLAEVAAAFGPGAIGINCGIGIEANLEAAAALVAVSPLPVIVQPNAGLPVSGPGGDAWPATPEDLAALAEKLREMGVSVIGSCCGSCPAHTRSISAAVRGRSVRGSPVRRRFCAASRLVALPFGAGIPFVTVGERINPTGRPKLAKAVSEGKLSPLKQSASSQVDAGAQALDVNIGIGDLEKELSFMPAAVRALDNLLPVPLLLDSMEPGVLEAGLLEYPGRAILNSLPFLHGRFEKGLEIAHRHGAAFIALLLDSSGVPGTASGRLRILDSILEQAHRCGLCSADIIVDPVVMVESACPGAARTTIEVIREISTNYMLPTIIGLSNVSFGLPGRRAVNRALLAQAIGHGLSAAILDPLDEEIMQLAAASWMLRGEREGLGVYVSGSKPDSARAMDDDRHRDGAEGLAAAIRSGSPEDAASAASDELDACSPTELVERVLLPAATELGIAYDEGRMFLPQLIAGAEAIRAAFEKVRERSGMAPRARILLATVEGDVHDIGKNIVAAVLAGNGWGVEDLGRDVPAGRIVDSILARKPDAVGLSALLTPSLPVVRATVDLIRSKIEKPPLLIIGGAVVSESFARDLGVLYGRDAVSGARVLEETFEQGWSTFPGKGGNA
jgi:5-methyltetrahydrofolate--homocysteine methyltransferase